MAGNTPTAAEWLDLLIERADALRKAGVTHVDLGGCAVTLAPPPVEMPIERDRPEPAEDLDPLNDPATYADGRVPGFVIPRDALDGDYEGRA